MTRKERRATQEYGAELGAGIKRGMQGLNTICSPRKRKTCIMLILIPLLVFILGLGVGCAQNNDNIMYVGIVGGLCLGLYQFYVGRIGKGLLFAVTMGGFGIGCLIDLFKLVVTKTFKDANNFPLIY